MMADRCKMSWLSAGSAEGFVRKLCVVMALQFEKHQACSYTNLDLDIIQLFQNGNRDRGS